MTVPSAMVPMSRRRKPSWHMAPTKQGWRGKPGNLSPRSPRNPCLAVAAVHPPVDDADGMVAVVPLVAQAHAFDALAVEGGVLGLRERHVVGQQEQRLRRRRPGLD